MIKYNLQRIADLHGYSTPLDMLQNLGYSYHVCHYLLKNSKTIQLKQLERLCVALRCTPNDLLEWVDDENHPLEEGHPLHKLARKRNDAQLRVLMQSIPSDKVNEAIALLNKLANEE